MSDNTSNMEEEEEEMDEPKPSFSRLDADFFTRNLHYASTYWEEHSLNFAEMLDQLMTEQTLEKLCVNATRMVLGFNEKCGWVDERYNRETISAAYSRLNSEIQNDKLFLWRLMETYFDVFARQRHTFSQIYPKRDKQDLKNSEEFANLRRVFSDDNPLFDDTHLSAFAAILLGPNYDLHHCRLDFYPQLILWFLRFLDIYDRSLQGYSVAAFLQRLKHPKLKPKSRTKLTKEEKLLRQIGEQLLVSFGKKSFWDNKYGAFGLNSALYEWYLPWSALRPYLIEHVPLFCTLSGGSQNTNDTINVPEAQQSPSAADPIHILEVGCGNSGLALELWNEWGERSGRVPHIQSVVAIDFCDRVIDVMRMRYGAATTDVERGLIYLVANAQDLQHFYLPLVSKVGPRTVQEKLTHELKTAGTMTNNDAGDRERDNKGEETKRTEVAMPEQTARYSVVIDKGALDSMVCTPNADTLIRQYLHEVSRVLRPGGYFVLVSCALSEERLSVVANTKLYHWHIRQNILHVKHQQSPLPTSLNLSLNVPPSESEEVHTNIYIILLQKE